MGKFSGAFAIVADSVKFVVKMIILIGIIAFVGRAAYIFITDRPIDASEVVGTYNSVSFFDGSIILHDNGTYDRYEGSTEMGKGIFEATTKSISFETDNNFNESTNLFYKVDGYYYRVNKDTMNGWGAAYFETDDYGREVTFDNQGRSDQTFKVNLTGSGDDVALTLNNDGSFVVTSNGVTGYEGTYHLQDEILTLNYGEGSLVFIYTDDKIYFDVYEKQE